MGFCLRYSSLVNCCLGCCLGGLLVSGAARGASFTKQTSVPVRVRSVVRADTRSGRLVRKVVVTPRVEAAAVAASPADSNTIPAESGVPEIIEAAAKKYDVDPLLVHSVIQVESAYNPYAMSPKGAQGLMQLMPGTARRFGVSNAFDVRDNIEGGVRYLKYLQTLFPDDPRLAVAAYNAGEAAVWKYNNQIPPYPETEQYVYRVGKKYGEAKKAAAERPKVTEPAPVRTAEAAIAPPRPEYAPVEHFIDAEGRLHMRTVPVQSSASAVSMP